MFAAIVSMMLSRLMLYSLFLFLFVVLVIMLALYTRNGHIARFARIAINISLGIFGVFPCKGDKVGRTIYCWMWIKLDSCFSIILAVLTGIVIMGFNFSLIPLMIASGVTSVITIYAPIVLYLVSLLTLFLVRRKYIE